MAPETRFGARILACLVTAACGSDPTPLVSIHADAGELRWFMTCGDAVCLVPSDAGGTDAGSVARDGGMAPCIGDQIDGRSCPIAGATCGEPERNCGSFLVCADRDPKLDGCSTSHP